jgi:hypothetical protein
MAQKRSGPAPVIPIAAAGKDSLGPARQRKETERKSEQKWGKRVLAHGFCIVPSLLLRAQARLGLDARELNVLLHLLDHWWEADRLPYPSKKKIADRMRVSPRQVQRYLAALELRGLIVRKARRRAGGGRTANAYDLSGLVSRLRQLEPQVRAADEKANAARRVVERPGLRSVAALEVE